MPLSGSGVQREPDEDYLGVAQYMPQQLMASAVVLVAQQFNPSITGQHWLVRHGIVGAEDFLPGSVFTDAFAQVITARFNLLATPEQFQFVPRVVEEEQQELIVDKVGTVIRTLPHTPYKAVGLNFSWHIACEEGDVRRLSRALFFRPSSPLYHEFDVEDANFGAYLSKDIMDFRLKLDVKPVTLGVDGNNEKRLQLLFNYHADIPEDAQAAEMIGGWGCWMGRGRIDTMS